MQPPALLTWKSFVTRAPANRNTDARISTALSRLRPCTETPARTPIPHAFNWSDVADAVVELPVAWFLVAFRSVRAPEADADTLHIADAFAHAEARVSGGLLAYYYSSIDVERRGLAMCVWQDAAAARAAATRPLHKRASHLAKAMYTSYVIELFALKKQPGTAHLAFEPVVSSPG